MLAGSPLYMSPTPQLRALGARAVTSGVPSQPLRSADGHVRPGCRPGKVTLYVPTDVCATVFTPPVELPWSLAAGVYWLVVGFRTVTHAHTDGVAACTTDGAATPMSVSAVASASAART